MEKNAIFDNIMARTSIRSYTSQAIEEEEIDILLRAGMAAPSACNKQPWHFIAITNREILDQIPTFSPYASMVKQAPLAIVVCGDLSKTLEGKEQEFWIQDCAAATENILLMAQGLQLGAVWTALYPLQNRYQGMQKLLHLPDNLVPLNTIVIGYPKEMVKAKDKWKKENVTRIK